MAYSHRAVCVEQKHCHGFSNDIASADDHAFFSVNGDSLIFEHFHNSCGCAWEKIVAANHDFADIYRMERVNVLVRRHHVDNPLFIKVLRKRQLYQDSVNHLVADYLTEPFYKLVHRSLGRQLVYLGVKSRFFASSSLVADVHLRRGVFAYDYYGKSGANSGSLVKLLRAFLYVLSDRCGYLFSVNYLCHLLCRLSRLFRLFRLFHLIFQRKPKRTHALPHAFFLFCRRGLYTSSRRAPQAKSSVPVKL